MKKQKLPTKAPRGARKSHDDAIVINIDGTQLVQLIHAIANSCLSGEMRYFEAYAITAETIVNLVDAGAEITLCMGDDEVYQFEGSEGDTPHGDASEQLMFFAEGRSLRIKMPTAVTIEDGTATGGQTALKKVRSVSAL